MSNGTTKRSGRFRRALWWRWLALWPATLALILFPVSNYTLRVATTVCFALLWTGIVGFGWRIKSLRWIVLMLTASASIALVLPGKHVATNELRERYVQSLRRYVGTRYIWGGENCLGIDCSGLVRAGLINADFHEGLRTLNPSLLRSGISLWWHDCSAQALGQEYHHLTRHLFEAPSLNDLDHSRIQPGDMAVAGDGAHVLAYLGEKNWIEADPDPDIRCVLLVKVPATNVWFDTPVSLTRWRQLDEAGQ